MAFYLHLPSNVSPQYYPENRISNFKVKLPKRLVFSPEEYVVALTEITYINCRKVSFTELERGVRYLVTEELRQAMRMPVIADKNYRNISILLDELNNAFSFDGKQYAKFTMKEGSKRVCIDVDEGWIILSQSLSKYLGFGERNEFELGHSEAWEEYGKKHDAYHMFVYADIVTPQIVGDTMVPLLRLISISGAPDEAVTQTFRPYYLSLSRLDFDCISILLCNEFGEEIQFDKGQAILTLHFKKK